MPISMPRKIYADMYGPTTGDKVRLADTELFIEVETDLTSYGDEVKFGGGKVIRDGMGQSQVSRDSGAVDTVITNALIIDVSGIYKADLGLKDGLIQAIGKAGNPDTQENVNIIIGPSTEAIAGEGLIITAGGFDSHIHFICPQQIDDALHSGITTMLGGGTGQHMARWPQRARRPMAYRTNAPSSGQFSNEFGLCGQRQCITAGGFGRTNKCWSLRAQAS